MSPVGRYLVDGIELNTDESNPRVQPVEIRLPKHREHPLEVLCRLGKVRSPEELGNGGPLVASVSSVDGANDHPELRRYEDIFPDALAAARTLGDLYPALRDATVDFFAAHVSQTGNEGPGAEPGAAPHHFYLQENGKPPAYRRTDATLLLLSEASKSIRRDPSRMAKVLTHSFGPKQGQPVIVNRSEYRLGHAVTDMAAWLLCRLDHEGGRGLLWIGRNNALGNSYTTWTDSPNHFHHKNGRLCQPPIASLLTQGQAYESLKELAELVRELPAIHAMNRNFVDLDEDRFLRRASVLRAAVLGHFVSEDKEDAFLSHAVDGFNSAELRATGVRACDMGMVLNTGLLKPEYDQTLIDSIARQLFSSELLTPFGIRGRGLSEARTFPFDYHAQVWAYSTHEASAGLRRLGCSALANELDARIVRQTHDGLMPEFVGGGENPSLEYCSATLTVDLLMVDGKTTTSVKQRPPQLFQAWTVAPLVAIEALAKDLQPATVGGVERQILDSLPDRAFRSPADLVWSRQGSRSLERAQRQPTLKGPELPGLS